MQVRFSCTSFAPVGSRIAVLGNCSELGDWSTEHAKLMECRLGKGRLQSEPDFHWVDIELPESAQGIEYKFIELAGGGEVKWEETGGGNRYLDLDGETVGCVHLLPVEKFGTTASESDHTGAFYGGVKERGEISVRQVTSQLWIGSCPRSTQHIDYLKSLGITAVANFQSESDCMRNCVQGIGQEENARAVCGEYERRGMQYIWMPTEDMCSEGRTQMLPQASQTFAELLRAGHTIYSHCNAGVGRSVSAACGYLTFVLGFTDRQMQHVVASSRPCAFFDFDALRRARPTFEAKFGKDASGRACHDADCRRHRDTQAATLSTLPSNSMLVRFSVVCGVNCGKGTRMAVIGSCPALGSWNTQEAPVLESSGPDFHWADVVLPVASGAQLEYKFIDLTNDAVKWEEFGTRGNRRLEAGKGDSGKHMRLPVAWFGELYSDEKQREEAMAVLLPRGS
eukprot:gnl/MRDRNA2_/MRDRNA2_67608_c0_seq1.p1 gnl/MRDRNA2_/MRDRNA2_67608_c0~~gnl/MRDRNA2_/MRDRNA2_67608_c0_seq1.p1  ORF type:complete len:453 (+),score=70.18 gnl/MRDRNA2_/MRDRNA2_67608_c0_seq1:140-1498(+)